MKKVSPMESEGMEVIEASYHPLKDWKMDPLGYFLIRVFEDKLEVGYCKKDNIILKRFIGPDAIQLYNTIVDNLSIQLEHAAYLGKELMKAEVCLKLKIPYEQDAPLDLRGFKREVPGDRDTSKDIIGTSSVDV